MVGEVLRGPSLGPLCQPLCNGFRNYSPPIRVDGAHGTQHAICGDQLKAKQLFACGSVRNRGGAGAVIAHHSAHHTAVRGGGVGTEKQPTFLEVMVEFIAYHTRLYFCPAFFHVDVDNSVHVPSGIQHRAAPYYLAREGGSCGAWDQWLARFNKYDNIISRFWKGHRFGRFLVDGSVLCVGALKQFVAGLGHGITP